MRIIGGTVAKPNSWPWQVMFYTFDTSGLTHLCGGTVISNQWIRNNQ